MVDEVMQKWKWNRISELLQLKIQTIETEAKNVHILLDNKLWTVSVRAYL